MVLQTTQNLVMTTKTYYPVTGTTLCSKLGKLTTATTNSVRYEWSASLKQSALTPQFVPGQFLVKPYTVWNYKFMADLVTLSANYCRTDGVYIEKEWVGKAAGLTALYTACPKSVARPTAELSQAVLAAYAKVSANPLDSLTELGELKETLTTLRHPFKTLRDYLTKPNRLPGHAETLADLTRFYLRRPKRFERDVRQAGTTAAQTWLEWRYGIRPILMTISDLLELASRQLAEASSRILTKRRRVPVSKTASTKEPYVSGIKTLLIIEEELRIEAIVYFRRQLDQTLADLLGFSIEKIPATAWELARLSFVVDWFFSVGDWIQAMTPSNSFVVLGCTQSWRWKCTAEASVSYWAGYGSVYSPMTNCGHYSADSFNREVLTGIPLPVFQAARNLDLQRVIDSLALMHTGIARKLR